MIGALGSRILATATWMNPDAWGRGHSGVLVTEGEAMRDSARYVKIVEWSDEDQCFVGSCPGLFYGGCHGDDEQVVFAELCEIVEETVELCEGEGRTLPPATAGRDYANKMLRLA